MLLVLAETKKEDEIEYFHYTEAVLFSDFDEDKFIGLLKEGKIVWEFRNPDLTRGGRGAVYRMKRFQSNELPGLRDIIDRHFKAREAGGDCRIPYQTEDW